MAEIVRGEDGSQLFLLRLWSVEGEVGPYRGEEARWRGRVQHVSTGRAESFDGWAGLVNVLVEMMPQGPAAAAPELIDGRSGHREE
jgi:hypothetical protein